MWFDSDFSFSKHVQKVCKGCFCQLRDFRNIRQFLTQDAAVSVANAFVSSRLDYCNSLFRSLSKASLHRLQSIQNCAARIVTHSCRYTCITPVLRKLHWLPIQFRSEFKLATLVYKFIHTGFPKYFAPHLSTPPLFGIHSLKTSVHHPLWPLLERSSKPISTQRLILLSSFFFWLLCGADLFFVPGL